MKVVLGRAGAIGSIAARILASSGIFSEAIIGDINFEKAKKLAAEIGIEGVSAAKVDGCDGLEESARCN